MPERNEQFLFEVEVKWSMISDFPSQRKHERNRTIPTFTGNTTFAIVAPDRDLDTIKKIVARLMDENHGEDTDTEERLIQKTWFIDSLKFLRGVRL
jgi:hypothetical protein